MTKSLSFRTNSRSDPKFKIANFPPWGYGNFSKIGRKFGRELFTIFHFASTGMALLSMRPRLDTDGSSNKKVMTDQNFAKKPDFWVPKLFLRFVRVLILVGSI